MLRGRGTPVAPSKIDSANILIRFQADEGELMVRGLVARQPAKTGRHEGARVSRSSKKTVAAGPGQKTGAARAKGKAPRDRSLKGYDPLAPERVSEILKRLDQLYPDVTCALTHKSGWELLVATILSAQSTDVNVNRVTPELFRKYPTVEDFAALTAGTT